MCLPFELLPDRAERIRAALEDPEPDVFLVSGGSSVGQEDHAPRLVAELGRLDFHGVSMRPSSPAGVGRLPGAGGERFAFLLPGNPVSCLCAYEFFAGPTLRRLGGRSPRWPHRRLRLPLARKISSAVGRTDYVRVAIEARPRRAHRHLRRVDPLSTVRADGCVIVPRGPRGDARGRRGGGAALRRRLVAGGRGVRQRQFLEVLDRDEAEARWRAAIAPAPLAAEEVALGDALGRVLAEDVRAEVDVPGFDRSNMDGFARARRGHLRRLGGGAGAPRASRPTPIPTGVAPSGEVAPGAAAAIATGGMLPRGADAVVPVEDTDVGGRASSWCGAR